MKRLTFKQQDKQTRGCYGGSSSSWLHQGEQEQRGRMCLNQSALSCSGTHFIRPSSWGRGSMRPRIYHRNPSGLSAFFTDSMCVIEARISYQKTHYLTRLIHFFFHLPHSMLRFLICGFPIALSVFPLCSVFPPAAISVFHFSLSSSSEWDICQPVLNGVGALLFLLSFISLPLRSPSSLQVI